MYRILVLFCILTLSGWCEPIHFKETRYINALQTTLYKEGWINIHEDSLELHYPKEKKSFLFTRNAIIEKKGEEEKILTYEEHLGLTIFSKLIKSIYTNQPNELKEFFTLKKENGTTILTPNEPISNSVDTIEYKKNHAVLEFLKINFTNEDWINIVENK